MKLKLTNKKGDWSDTEKWMKKNKNVNYLVNLMQEYGRKGVAALAAATPVDTGETASSWDYQIVQNGQNLELQFVNNSKTYQGTPIVILLHYGHGNGHGGYVRGKDFINLTLKPIFDELEEKALKEISK